MKSLDTLKQVLDEEIFSQWHEQLPECIDHVLQNYTHGQLNDWLAMISQLPDIAIADLQLEQQVGFTAQTALSEAQIQAITAELMMLHPWRKGPFQLDAIDLNTEWRSDWKWERIAPHLSDCHNQAILDVGCGNGYHLFRMAGLGAKAAIGIDPSQKFYAQFLAINHFLKVDNVWHLPCALEDLPIVKGFDKVFSMGVLYHRRSPIDHIRQLKSFVRKGGELILETLVVDGDQNTALVPEGRYAQMRNVWFLPSTAALKLWLNRCDLVDVRLVDENKTTVEEQRATEWMTFHSLANYLDPDNSDLTIEGYPAPRRATFIAKVVD